MESLRASYQKMATTMRVDDIFVPYQQALLNYDCSACPEELFSWISCVLALKAVSYNNLGVGALLVQDNKILHEACNEMLHPYFRSDGHPEMMVLSAYEATHGKILGEMKTITLYSSLEPCPMCLTRISSTGIGAVKYVAEHEGSGMAHCIDKLPVLWQVFCEDMQITQAACSSTLKKIAHDFLDASAQKQIPHLLTYKSGKLPDTQVAQYMDHLSRS